MNSPTEQQQWYYKIAYFFIANQILLKRLFVLILLFLNIGLWWFSGVKLVNYLAETKSYNKMINELPTPLTDWVSYRLAKQPENLQVSQVDKISLGNNRYNLVAQVFNPNIKWSVRSFSYAFVVDGFVLEWQDGHINPNEQKYVFDFSYTATNYPNDIGLKIGNISWQPITPEDQTSAIPLDQINIVNKNFVQGQSQSSVDFEVFNNSHFNFWQIGWQIVLYQGERAVAVNYLNTTGFLSGEQRKFSVSFLEKISPPSSIQIIPDLDVFDKNNYFFDNEPPVNLIKGARDIKNQLAP